MTTTIQKFTTYEITGNTYAFRGDIKGIGGSWNKDTEAWIVEVGGMKSVGQARYVLERAERGGCTVTKIG